MFRNVFRSAKFIRTCSSRKNRLFRRVISGRTGVTRADINIRVPSSPRSSSLLPYIHTDPSPTSLPHLRRMYLPTVVPLAGRCFVCADPMCVCVCVCRSGRLSREEMITISSVRPRENTVNVYTRIRRVHVPRITRKRQRPFMRTSRKRRGTRTAETGEPSKYKRLAVPFRTEGLVCSSRFTNEK